MALYTYERNEAVAKPIVWYQLFRMQIIFFFLFSDFVQNNIYLRLYFSFCDEVFPKNTYTYRHSTL